MKVELRPLQVRKSNIWSFAQNKPTLIAKDMYDLFDVPYRATYAILLARGVFKWLSVRRDIIKMKDRWKVEINETLTRIIRLKFRVTIVGIDEHERRKRSLELAYQRGYLAALTACRQDVRRLCHSERWQAPDFDKEANRFLASLDIADKFGLTNDTAAD